jgi:hypothetical protein
MRGSHVSGGTSRAEKRRAMRQAGYRRSDSRKGRRPGIRVRPTPEQPALQPVQGQPGLAQTESGLVIARTGILTLR